MILRGIEVRRLALELRKQIGTATGAHRSRDVVYVRVVTSTAEGWGECGAMAGGTPADPDLGTVWRVLVGRAPRRLATAARARRGVLPPASQVSVLFDQSGPSRFAASALEMAVLDAELRTAGEALHARLGTERTSLPAGAVVGIPEDRRVSTLLRMVERVVTAGYGRVRVKIEPGWDLWPLRAIREEYPRLHLQADANGSYRWGIDGENDAARLAALDPIELACVEQPLPATDLPSHAALGELLKTPVCLDESLTSLRQLRDAIRYGACEVACLKPARLGGLFAARQAQELCRGAGVPAFVGGLFETGLARSANVALAALLGFTMPGDLSAPSSYLVEDPCGFEPPAAGTVVPSAEPGVGPSPDPTVLALKTVALEWFPFTP